MPAYIAKQTTPGPRAVRDLLLAAVRERHALLILDNLEHLPAMAGLVEAILANAPAVRILATSRRRLGMGAEHVHEVPPLSGDSARALSVDRARRLDPDFDPDARALARICAAVGGLPLAVELAAALTRALTCGDLADRLDAGDPPPWSAGVSAHPPVDLLVHPAPAVAARHGSMKEVFNASWQLLGTEERRTLSAAAVFGGGSGSTRRSRSPGRTPRSSPV